MNILIYYKKPLLIVLAILSGMGIKVFGQDTAMYRGGFADGANSQLVANFYPAKLNHYAMYSGGIKDGGALATIENFYPTPLSQFMMYKGGFGDGAAGLEEHLFNPTRLNHQIMYAGNVGDGASLGMYEDYTRAYLDHYSIYAGGQGDGYAGHLAVSFTPLPVNLLSFTGDMMDNRYGLLEWRATDEKGTPTYELQKSKDGKLFSKIYSKKVSIAQVGMQNYQYEDHQLIDGANYYRLKISDKDGNAKFSDVVLLFYKDGSESLTLFPNPATTSLNINYKSRQSAQVRLVDIKGAIQYQQSIQAGAQLVSMPLHNIAAGTYILHFIYENGKTRTVKFVKE